MKTKELLVIGKEFKNIIYKAKISKGRHFIKQFIKVNVGLVVLSTDVLHQRAVDDGMPLVLDCGAAAAQPLLAWDVRASPPTCLDAEPVRRRAEARKRHSQ